MTTKIDEELILKLKKMWDHDDFIVGVFSNAPSQEARKTIIKYIDLKKDATTDDILLLSVELSSME